MIKFVFNFQPEKPSKKRKRTSSTESESAAPKPKKSLLSIFQRKNELEQDSETSETFDIRNISTNDEIYLLQLPKHLNPKIFLKKELSFEERSKFSKKDVSYVCTPEKTKSVSVTLIGRGKCKVLRSHGSLFVEQYSKQKYKPNLSPMHNESRVEFPKGLKVRHPLFGFDFSEKIDLGESIQKKLSCEESVKRSKKSKKHKRAKE